MRPGKRAVIKQAATLAVLGAAIFLAGCSGFFKAVTTTTTGSGTTNYIYVTNVSSTGTGGTLTAYSQTSGVLTALSGSPYTLTGTPTSLVVAPNNAFLYVGTTIGVYLYNIGSDGTLTLNATTPVVYQNQNTPIVQSMAVDSTNTWLIIVNRGATEVDALPIDATTGIQTSNSYIPLSLGTATTPQQVTISPANDNVFVAMGVNGVRAVSFTASSSTPFGTKVVSKGVLKTNGADNTVAVDTTSAYLFVGEATSNQLRSISITDLNQETDIATGVGPSAILPDKTGAYVYVANATDGNITGYTFSAGTLTVLGDAPFTSSASPIGLAEDATKTYVFSVGSTKTPNLWLYSFDATTASDLDVKTTASTGTNPSLSNAIAVTH